MTQGTHGVTVNMTYKDGTFLTLPQKDEIRRSDFNAPADLAPKQVQQDCSICGCPG